jgi:hypothetical protein
MGANLQPIFARTPILITTVINPVIVSSNYNPNPTFDADSLVFTATDSYGTLINKITISATGDTTNTTVTAKLIYVYLQQYGNDIVLYKTVALPAATVSNTVSNPSVEIQTTGLILNSNDKMYVGASANYSTATSYGDYLAITIEGGSYGV